MANYQDWYHKNYHHLTGYGLWAKGGELNTIPNSSQEWQGRFYKVLWTRLSTYQDVGDSYTHQLLYQISAQCPDIFPDLAYLPPPNDAALFKKEKIPWLLGTQSKHDWRDFNLLAFSNSILQELANIPQFLQKSGIPLNRQKRLDDPQYPLILLGGANALYSSILWQENSWVDAIFVGSNYLTIKKLLNTCAQEHKNGE
ncbi:MAG: hypothetical protein WCG27_09860 [Pseudomonadota bacterium]